MTEVNAGMTGLRFARADVPLLDRVLTALRGGTEAFAVPEGYLTGGDGGRLIRRMLTRRRDDGTIELAANLAVHETMTGVGLVDLTASVPATRRDPSELGTTSVHGGGRIDRDYATDGVQDAVVRHVQMVTGGSDHHARLTIMSKTALAGRLTPREPTP